MIRIFVGTAANHEDAESQAVLEWSARKHASEPIEFVWMKQAHSGFWSGWDTSRWATPFSGFRWGIPAYCNFEGRAIYTDSDVIFMRDPAILFNASLQPGKAVMAKGRGSWRFCVSLWDCTAAKAHLPDIDWLRGNADAHSLMGPRFRQAAFVQSFPDGQNWNCLDGEDLPLTDPSVCALHYTAMANQPHLKHAIPRLTAQGRKHWFDGEVKPHWRQDVQDLFDALLQEAAVNDCTVDRYLADPLFGPYKKKSLVNYRAGPRR